MMYGNPTSTIGQMPDMAPTDRQSMNKAPYREGVNPGVAAIMQAMQARQAGGAGGMGNGYLNSPNGTPMGRMMPRPVAPMQVGSEQVPMQAGQAPMAAEMPVRKPPASVEQSMRDSRLAGLSPDLQRRLSVFMNNRG